MTRCRRGDCSRREDVASRTRFENGLPRARARPFRLGARHPRLRAGHRRHHRRLHRLQRRHPAAPAVSGFGSSRRRVRDPALVPDLPRVLSGVPGLEDTQPGVLGDWRVDADGIRDDGARRRDAGRRDGDDRLARRRLWRRSGDRPLVHRAGGPVRRAEAGGPVTPVLDEALQRRPRRRGAQGGVRRRALRDHRRDARDVSAVVPLRRRVRAAAAQARSRQARRAFPVRDAGAYAMA